MTWETGSADDRPLPDDGGDGTLRSFAGLKICVIANFGATAGGVANLARLLSHAFENEGATVFRVSRQKRRFLRPVSTLLGAVRSVPRCDVVQVVCASWLSFLRAAIGVSVGRLFGKPVTVWYHGGEAESFLRRWAWIAKPFLLAASSVDVSSRFLQDTFARWGIETRIVPNLFDETPWTYRERTEYQPRILAVRHLEPIYGMDTVIRAFGLVADAHPAASLTIVGVGSQEGDLRALAQDLKLPGIEFAGRVSAAELGDLYDLCDLFVSAARIDNSPVTVMEAAASGLPVVATDVGGVSEFVEDGVTGVLVLVDDDRAMGEALLSLIEDPTEASRIARSGRERVLGCTWANQRDRWLKAYSELLARRP